MLLKFSFVLLSVFCGQSFASAQSPAAGTRNASASDTDRKPDRGSPEEEMLHRAEIRRGEEAHQEMLERAKEGAEIVLQIKQQFEKNSALGTEELKSLERVEKLVRKIRGSSGGSDDDSSQNLPLKADAAIGQLVDAFDDLSRKVEKTSRLVTSAAVIQRSNEVIRLVKHIRTLFR